MKIVIAEVAADVLLAEDLKTAITVIDHFNATTDYLQIQLRLLGLKIAEYVVYFKGYIKLWSKIIWMMYN